MGTSADQRSAHHDNEELRGAAYSPSMPIVFRASELAACIGKNPYTKRPQALVAVWRRVSPETHDAALERLGIVAPNYESAGGGEDALSLSPASLLSSPSALSSSPSALSSSPAVPPPSAHDLSLEYMEYGTRREPECMKRAKDITGTAWESPPHAAKTLWLGHVTNVSFGVCGIADGIFENKILEIKNRIHKLHRRAPQHEYIQVQAYIRMYGAESGYLLEFLGDAYSLIRILRDDDGWDRIIAPELSKAAADVVDLIRSTSAQDALFANLS